MNDRRFFFVGGALGFLLGFVAGGLALSWGT